MLCNLWPYWHSTAAFGAGNMCRGDQYLFPPSLTPADTPTTCPTGMNCNGKWYVGQQGWFHDSWFTDEARYLFTHTGAFTLQFYGDDDMFIFINGKLVIDLGGVHQRLPGRVDVERGRHGDNHRGRLARHHEHDHPAVPVARSVHGPDDEQHGQRGRQRSQQLHQHHLRLPHPHGQPGPGDEPDLRDRGVRRRSPPDRVELPAHAVGLLDAEVELHAPLWRRQADRRGGVRLRRRDRPRVDGSAVCHDEERGRRLRRLHDDVQVRSVLRRRRGRHGRRARSATTAAAATT